MLPFYNHTCLPPSVTPSPPSTDLFSISKVLSKHNQIVHNLLGLASFTSGIPSCCLSSQWVPLLSGTTPGAHVPPATLTTHC